MPLDQFSALIDLLPHIETVLKAKGAELPRPDYQGLPPADDAKNGEDLAEDESKDQVPEGDNEVVKKNFEATSDEDDVDGDKE